jgi:hypothetical protein
MHYNFNARCVAADFPVGDCPGDGDGLIAGTARGARVPEKRK